MFLAERFGAGDQRIVISGDESGKLTGEKAGPVVLESASPGAPALHLFRLRAATVSPERFDLHVAPAISWPGGLPGITVGENLAAVNDKSIQPMTGKLGEVVRVGVVVGAITVSGREQDYKVVWPAGLMFSDPTRSYSFVLGR